MRLELATAARTLRRAPVLAMVSVSVMLAGMGVTTPARAGSRDLDLMKLCGLQPAAPGGSGAAVLECSWVRRGAGGLIAQVAVPADAEAQFRSLMSELGAVMAPRLVVPADTLGFGGFQVAGELGVTRISRSAPFWSAIEGVARENTAVGRPPEWVTTAGAFVRKGVWLGLPAVELGAGVVSLLESSLLSWQGYAKVALYEGYHRRPIPSLAVRGSAAYLGGTDQARVTITAFDVIVSQRLGVLSTFRLEPFLAWSLMRINARSGLLDATPSCDAFRARTSAPGQPLGEFCAEAQRGTDNDRLANFTFPSQSPIRRQRVAGGVKVKFATVFLTAEYDLFPAGRTRDGKRANGARDDSGRQQSVSLSGGFDY
jgi:hypothetical protein